jgi:hypothetical protein
MNRARVFGFLRIGWSVGWGIVAVLWIAWWVRSYAVIDNVNFDFPGKSEIQLFTTKGSFAVSLQKANLGWFWNSPKTWLYDREYPGPLQFQFTHVTGCSTLRMPYWFLVSICAAIAASSWPHWRFSLRTLLIATTLVAVVLGVIAYSSQ